MSEPSHPVSDRSLPWIIRSKRNALIFSTLLFGVGMPIYLISKVSVLQSFGMGLFVTVVCCGAGYVWGLIMWRIFLEPRLLRLRQAVNQETVDLIREKRK